MAESRVLVLDADSQRAESLCTILQFIDYTPVRALAPSELKLEGRRPQDWLAVVVGTVEDPQELRRFSDWMQRDHFHPPLLVYAQYHERVIEITGFDRSACIVLDYPARYAQLNDLLRRAGLLRMEQEAAVTRHSGPTGNSAPARRIRRMVEQVAPHDSTVLITGESGTGKEVVARAIHEHSHRQDRPFVAVNCGAIPSELLESELFGHEKGAFTGAITARRGRFEMADGGTLFLDEIGDMSLPMQVKILRVLQERTYERVGSSRSVRCDVRIIAATHRNLEESIVKGTFREDLFYRLNVFPVEMPPLRERIEDLPLLIDDLIAALARSGHGTVKLAPDAVHLLRTYHWPGNVRELSNLIERLAVLHPSAVVTAADLPQRYRGKTADAQAAGVPAVHMDTDPANKPAQPVAHHFTQLPADGLDLKDHIETIEISLILQALEKSSGVVAHAAKLLNTRRTTLVEKLRKYGLHRDLVDGTERANA